MKVTVVVRKIKIYISHFKLVARGHLHNNKYCCFTYYFMMPMCTYTHVCCCCTLFFNDVDVHVYVPVFWMLQISYLLGEGATYLIQSSSVNDAGRVESMVKELQTSVDTLKSELTPSSLDDISQVEAELESVISEQDVIDRGMFSC